MCLIKEGLFIGILEKKLRISCFLKYSREKKFITNSKRICIFIVLQDYQSIKSCVDAIFHFLSIIKHYWILLFIFKNSFLIEYTLFQYFLYQDNLYYIQFLIITLFVVFYQHNQSYINYLILNSSKQYFCSPFSFLQSLSTLKKFFN